MPKYKIVTGEPVSDESSDPIVEVRLVMDGSRPTLEARNPGDKWNRVACFDPDGRLMLSICAGNVAGLNTKSMGEIITY